jgi:hypothetical protein
MVEGELPRIKNRGVNFQLGELKRNHPSRRQRTETTDRAENSCGVTRMTTRFYDGLCDVFFSFFLSFLFSSSHPSAAALSFIMVS